MTSEQPVSYDRAPNGVCYYMFKACYPYVFSFYPLILVLGQNRMFDVIVFYTLCPCMSPSMLKVNSNLLNLLCLIYFCFLVYMPKVTAGSLV